MLPLPIGTLVKAVVALVIVVMFAVGFWWITGLRADLAVSQANTEKLTQAVAQQQAVMEQMKVEQEQIRVMTKAVNDQVTKQNNDVNALRDRFNTTANGQTRNWGKTASEKPVAVERAVNRGTVNALRCLEIASGAPLTEAEKNATRPEQINRECPAIANPLYRPPASR